jgi:hypothetical protein
MEERIIIMYRQEYVKCVWILGTEYGNMYETEKIIGVYPWS